VLHSDAPTKGDFAVVKRIAAIAFIFVCTSVAWAALGATILARTFDADFRLRDRVHSTWGSPQTQRPPVATWEERVPKTTEVVEDGKKTARTVTEVVARPIPLEASDLNVALELEHRQKGLLWYSTYKVSFAGAYAFRNDTDQSRPITFTLQFPAERAIYDDFAFLLDDKPLAVDHTGSQARSTAVLSAGQSAQLKVRYLSQGVESWRYDFGGDVAQARNFRLRAATNFREVDFPDNTLSPSEKRETPNGWDLTWSYKNLVSGFQIGIAMPEKLQPGPLAGRISFFAPVSLFFFFFLMFIITTLRNIELHPMNYFFLAAAFFSFHLLLAYLVDHISIHAAFAVSSAVAVFLVVSYLRLVVGIRFAAVEAALAQLLYLVLFSYAFFFEGYTGLTVTIGSVLTLFVVMQMTGRVRWSEKFAPAKP
jgi:inner membrane protein involved in colicin E2 resistance